MRVLHVLEATLGGTRRYLEGLSIACGHASYRNGLAYSLERADAGFLALLRDLQHAGWETFEIPMRRGVGLHDFASVASLRGVLQAFAPDVVHAHSSKAGGLARIAAIGSKSKPAIVYSPHSIATGLSVAYELAERALAPMLNALIAVGQSEWTELNDLQLVPTRLIPIVVPAVDSNYFQPRDRVRAREDLGYPDRPTVCAVGRLVPQKDPLGFAKFFAQLRELMPDVRALWVGDGEMRPAFERALRAANVDDVVQITGWVSDVRPYLAASDLFVSTSAYESFGYVTAEALASGRPVVASAIPGTLDIVTTDTELQLYPVGDFARATKIAHTLLSDRELADRVAERGRDFVISSFDSERTRLQIAAAYRLALQHHSRKQAYPARKESIVRESSNHSR